MFFTAELMPEHEALYMVEIGRDGQPAPSVLLSQPDEVVTVVHVLPPL